jgi:hypothetical protein
MSVLVPEQEPLRRRFCSAEHVQELETWFAAIQPNAWAYVNAVPSVRKRPPKIVLVTEQIMAKAYAISHNHARSLTCSVAIETNAEVPTLLKADVLTGYTMGRVSLSSGFQRVRTASEENDMYSLFFTVVEAAPITIFGTAPIEKLIRVHA